MKILNEHNLYTGLVTNIRFIILATGSLRF